MNKFNRDLLVLFKEELASPQAIEHEVEMLHELLYTVEKMDNLTVAHEVIDVNKFRITASHEVVTRTLGQKQMKPFIFLFNRN